MSAYDGGFFINGLRRKESGGEGSKRRMSIFMVASTRRQILPSQSNWKIKGAIPVMNEFGV